MSHQTTPDPETGRLRRRVIFELTEGQLALLDHAERRHGSKRAGIIAALAAYADADGPAAAPGQADSTQQELEEVRAQHKSANAQLAEARRELAAAQMALAIAERDRDEARAQLGRADELRVRLEDASARETDALGARLAELRASLPRELYCPRCQTWVPRREWAWQQDEEGGEYAYHRPCGDHAGGFLETSSRLARR